MHKTKNTVNSQPSLISVFLSVFVTLCFLNISFITFTQESSKSNFTINITEFKNNDGKVLLSIFKDNNGFPDESEKAAYLLSSKIKNQSAQFTLEDVPYGNYAISVIHDENNNGKLETNLFGIPQEAVGMSQNVMGAFGPPSFNEAKIKVNSPNVATTIRLRHY
ncbi:hypothetical protein CW751_03845 [Brumimicrobium salinarum]|uniref:DUF2141 domain-containing protein n=1 Tax=Brumimicrobium salinarum TaxID=2058658 RepID=A0A2I0R549_9FLAO|nr:DUF2141 domain-containing protein [Brumimicrobium salinarum]PKR81669.1 hypothetical protein CW751_03845 [Brumimicrobium salinarum]